MDLRRIVADTQISTQPIFIKMIVLSHSSATSCDFYDEADSSKTAAAKRISLQVVTGQLTKDIVFPGRGLRFPNGCYCDWTAGEIFYSEG